MDLQNILNGLLSLSVLILGLCSLQQCKRISKMTDKIKDLENKPNSVKMPERYFAPATKPIHPRKA